MIYIMLAFINAIELRLNPMASGHILLPRMIEHPTSQSSLQGARVRFACATNMLPETSKFLWLFNDKLLANNKFLRILKNELVIRKFDRSVHIGNYSCLASTPFGWIRSHPAKLKHLDDSFNHSKQIINLNVITGSLIILHCFLPNNITRYGQVFWFTPNGQIFDDSAKYHLTRNLYIMDLQFSDNGLYHCALRNTFSDQIVNDTTKTFLHVHEDKASFIKKSEQKIIEPPSAIRAVVGDNITLDCGLTPSRGMLNPISWEKFGSTLPTERAHSDNTTGILRIKNLTQQDRGTYICKITLPDKGFPHMFKSLIEVEERPKLESSALSEGIEVLLGSNVELSCPARGKPEPHIFWYFNGRQLNETKFHRESKKQTLSLEMVTKDDEGIYQCFAENIHGVTSKTFLINLQLTNKIGNDILVNQHNSKHTSHDKMDGVSDDSKHHKMTEISGLINNVRELPNILAGPSNSTAFVGETVLLSCVVEGEGYFYIRWIHNGRQLRSSQTGSGRLDSTGATGSLRIYDARESDSGVYTCVVDTGTHAVQASGFVNIFKSKDDIHYSKWLASKNSETLTIKEISENTFPVYTHYKNQMKIHSRRPSNSIESLPSKGSNEDVKIVLTDITNLGMDEGIALKWDVLHGSSNIDFFKVLYQTFSNEGQMNGYFALDESLFSDARSYIVDSLKPTTTYNFKIEAITKSGRHFSSNSKNFTLLQPNTIKIKSLSAPVILEIWEVPSDGPSLDVGLKWKIKANQQIDGFKIHYNVVSDNKDTSSIPNEIKIPVGPMKSSNANQNSRIFTHLVKNLRHSKEYEFRICAFNRQQSSELSNIVSIFKSDDGAESVVHIQDISNNVIDKNGFLSELDGTNRINAVANSDKRSSKYLLGDGSNSGIYGSNHNHQAMLLYTSLAIAIVSLLLLLFTATLVLMLRHYRRRQRFRNIVPYGESLCSFESKHPCLATRKPYNSNCTECYCENLSTSTNRNILTLPKLFSFNKANNSRIISPASSDVNTNGIMNHSHHSHNFNHMQSSVNAADNAECSNFLNRCSGCHVLMDTLNHKDQNEEPASDSRLSSDNVNKQCIAEVGNQIIAYDQTENFYHTLAETALPNGESLDRRITLKCQCCGQTASHEEAFNYEQQRKLRNLTNCCHHCCICSGGPTSALIPYPSTIRSRIATSSSGSGTVSANNRNQPVKKLQPKEDCSEVVKPLLDCLVDDDEQSCSDGNHMKMYHDVKNM